MPQDPCGRGRCLWCIDVSLRRVPVRGTRRETHATAGADRLLQAARATWDGDWTQLVVVNNGAVVDGTADFVPAGSRVLPDVFAEAQADAIREALKDG